MAVAPGRSYTEQATRATQVAAVLRQVLPIKDPFRPAADAVRKPADAFSGYTSDDVALPGPLVDFATRVGSMLRAHAGAGHPNLSWDAWWEHSVRVACMAFALAERSGRVAAGDAFAAGLLHDVGKLGLAVALPKTFARLERRCQPPGVPPTLCEHDHFGLDHATAGRLLLESWGGPPAWAEAIWLHHKSAAVIASSARDARCAAAVALANRLAHDDDMADECRALGAVLGLVAGAMEQAVSAAAKLAIPLHDASSHSRSARIDVASGSPAGSGAPAGSALQLFAELAAGADSVDDLLAAIVTAAARATRGPAASYVADHNGRPATAVCGTGTVIEKAAWARSARKAERLGRRREGDDSAAIADELADRFTMMRGCEAFRLIPFDSGGRIAGGLLLMRPGADKLAPSCDADVQDLARVSAWALGVMQARDDAVRVAAAVSAESAAAESRITTSARDAAVASIAEMAAGAAHELNNPLSVIAGRAQLLRQAAVNADMARQIEAIDQQARRASQIVAELVQFAKPSPPDPAVIPLADWVSRLCQYWQSRSLLSSASIAVQLADPRVRLLADPAQLDEAAHAVMANAIDSMSSATARLVINSRSAATDDTVVVSFGDNGCGMPADVLRHACDPFFSSRPAGRGRGMGLARAARLLQINGGRLWIESAPQAGTCVYFALPAACGASR